MKMIAIIGLIIGLMMMGCGAPQRAPEAPNSEEKKPSKTDAAKEEPEEKDPSPSRDGPEDQEEPSADAPEGDPEEDPSVDGPQENGLAVTADRDCEVKNAEIAAFDCVLARLEVLAAHQAIANSTVRAELEQGIAASVESVEEAKQFYSDRNEGMNAVFWSLRVASARLRLSGVGFAYMRARPAGSGAEGINTSDPVLDLIREIGADLDVVFNDR